ncbi:MAG TPA: hypothetical protein PK872_05975 [Ferruginibacter sp.]|nr:hypothetical protein [Niastella sp.]HRB31040.1 hypothetical protein [Ferruginibacter sp.]
MKYIIILLFFFSSLACFGQSTGKPNQQNVLAESFNASNLGKNNTLIALKKQAWFAPANAMHWWNYFLALDHDESITASLKQAEMQNSISQASNFIKETWQYNLMLFIQSGKKEKDKVFKALSLAKDKNIIYPYLVQYAIIAKDKQALNEYANKLNETNPLTQNLYEYHYNTLMSATQGAFIYANGIADLVALAMVQAGGIRKDIELRYYDAPVIQKENAYLCLSLGRDIIRNYPKAFYTGLLICLDEAKDFTEMKDHIENDFKFSFISQERKLAADEIPLYKNYLPSLILLYKSYGTATPMKEFIKKKIEYIAKQVNMEAQVNEILKKAIPL